MTKEKIHEAIRDMTNANVINAWIEYVVDRGYPDERIYDNDCDFLDTFFNLPSDAVRAVEHGNYKSNDDYVTFDSYGNVRSFNGWEDYDSPINADILADWLFENQEKLEEFGIDDEEGEEEDEED